VREVGTSETKAAVPSPPTDTAEHAHAHHPLIKFIGKRPKTRTQPAAATPTTPIPPATKPAARATQPTFPTVNTTKPSGRAVDFATLKDGALYGRPKMTAKEMEAIESGGAY
jgi:hypothetical protein